MRLLLCVSVCLRKMLPCVSVCLRKMWPILSDHVLYHRYVYPRFIKDGIIFQRTIRLTSYHKRTRFRRQRTLQPIFLTDHGVDNIALTSGRFPGVAPRLPILENAQEVPRSRPCSVQGYTKVYIAALERRDILEVPGLMTLPPYASLISQQS